MALAVHSTDMTRSPTPSLASELTRSFFIWVSSSFAQMFYVLHFALRMDYKKKNTWVECFPTHYQCILKNPLNDKDLAEGNYFSTE